MVPNHPLGIHSLTAENIKKIKIATIRPTSSTTVISGKNGQGKTSLLDSYWWALGGKEAIQQCPIREGQEKASIKLELGANGLVELTILRTFKRVRDKETGEETSQTTSLEVWSSEGAKFTSPQTLLDALYGSMTFDPLTFARMDDKERFNILRSFVKEFDFDAYDKAQKEDYDKRTVLNRKAQEAKALASTLNVPANAPAEPVDEQELVKELSEAGKKAAEREKVVAENRKRLEAAKAATNTATHAVLEQSKQIADTEETLRSLQAKLTELREKLPATQSALIECQEAEKVAQATPEPDPIDIDSITKKVNEAKTLNAAWELKNRKLRAEEEAEEFVRASEALTKAMNDRKEARDKAIRSSKMPMDGLTITEDNRVFLNGVPFGQGSDAEQLRASVAVGMALNTTIRVLRVRDGSLLDEDGMNELEKMALEHGYQVLIERVDGSGKVGIVLEDGEVKAIN